MPHGVEVPLALAMLASVQGWNAAEHRRAEPLARLLAATFFVLLALLFCRLLTL
jgi:hypothetical protein